MASQSAPGRPNAASVAATAMGSLAAELRRRGLRAGLAAVGIAPATPMEKTRLILEERKAAGLAGGMQFTYRNPSRSTDPGRALPGAAALVVGAWSYGDRGPKRQALRPANRTSGAPAASDVGQVPDGAAPAGDHARPKGVVARYASRDHYGDLRAALGTLAVALEEAGWAARVVMDDNALVDRAAAELAGLGWFGKNTNVLLPGRGSWFLLGSVLTEAPLPCDVPVAEGCGTCRRCLGSCPTGALVAPGVLDARRCLAWLLQAPGTFPFEYREALGARIYGCDDCQESCPANRVATGPGAAAHGSGEGGDRRGTVDESAVEESTVEESTVDLLEMLDASDAALLARHGRWYIAQRDPRYLRRNALVVLGNVADGNTPAVQEALERYLGSPDDMLRAHAVWAAGRLGRRDLLAGARHLADDPSAMVRDEVRCLNHVRPRAQAQPALALFAGRSGPGRPSPRPRSG